MKNWTIKRRIVVGFVVILTLFAIAAISSITLLRQVKANQGDVINKALPGVTSSSEIKYIACEIELAVARHLIAKTPEEKKAIEAIVDSQAAEVRKLTDAYEKTIVRQEDRDQYNRVMAARDGYVKARNDVMELSREGKDAECTAQLKSTLRPAYAAYIKELDAMTDENSKFASAASGASDKAINLANTLTTLLGLITILIGIAFGFVIVRGINNVLGTVSSSLDEGSNQVASAASQVSTASQSLAEGASEQAASLEETSSSLEEMASMTKRNAENAQKANDLAKGARHAADKGAADMQSMSSAMEAIKVSSDDIAKIIKTIDEIAFQTNILALNAAVEAARAGEAGMGFAVVADEVRNLAQRSAQAAKETAAKIEGAISKTAQGVDISQKVAATLNEIVTKARQVDELVAEVSSASREQSQGITQINTAVTQMDKVTQSNAASAEESAAAAEELNSQAEIMKESVSKLLELVGGRATTKSAAPVTRTKDVRPAATPVKRAAAPANNVKTKANGHAKPAPEPATATATAAVAAQRGTIPMEGDFTSF